MQEWKLEDVLLLVNIQSKAVINMILNLFLNFLRYEIKELTFDQKDDIHGIVINFNEDVQVKTSHWRIDTLTLIVRIGGIIGVGQTIAWVLNICFEKLKNIYVIFIVKK